MESQGSKNLSSYKIVAYKGLVVSQPRHKKNFYTAVVKINSVKDTIWRPTSYRINFYLKADSSLYQYGDQILVKGTPTSINPPQNPEEFNYKQYLSFLTIYQQHFTNASLLQVVSSGNGNPFITKSHQLRNQFSNLLETYIKETKKVAIAKALLLGNKNELDDDIINTYAAAGAMHVLAVSGLHVGIIYAIIFWLFSLLPKQHQKKWLIALISIPLLWAYAFITGLSPSVLRAVTLFSIIAIGNSFNQKTNMVNLLAVSAFFLLLFKPYLLMLVGFQLSYVAVLGIIFIYPQIRKLWLPSNWFNIFFWDVISISMAAQIATFPLSILYFHRFPPYFLISNILVIPMATLIVGVGIVFFLFSYFVIIAKWLGWFLGSIIGFVNYVLELIYNLPGSNWDNIYISVPQTWVMYILIVFLFLFFVYKEFFWAKWASLSMILLSLLIGYQWVHNNQLKQIISYKIANHYAIDFIQSGSFFSVMDSSLMHLPNKIHFHIKPNRMLTEANKPILPKIVFKPTKYGKAIVWNKTSILILNKSVTKKYPFDIVFFTHKPNKFYFNKASLSTKNISKKKLLRINL
jgi:competence protein ComEC